MSHVLWRDACALSKALQKKLSELPGPLSQSMCDELVQHIWSATSLGSPLRFKPRRATPCSTLPGLSLGGRPGLRPGLLLGKTPAKFLSKPKSLYCPRPHMLGQLAVYGDIGSGRTETLLAQAYNAAAQKMGVVYMDSKGENIMYAKVLSFLSELGQAGDLRVINLMTQSLAGKGSHSLDLFDGFDATALASWLLDLLPAGYPHRTAAMEVLPIMASIALTAAATAQKRLRPSMLSTWMNRDALEELSSRQSPRQSVAINKAIQSIWGPGADPGWADTLETIQVQIEPLWKEYAHVFDQVDPEVGFSQVYQLEDQISAPSPSVPSRLFVLVLGPAMSQAPDRLHAVMSSITLSLRQHLLSRAPTAACNTLAVIDEARFHMSQSERAELSRLQDRGCAFLWGEYSPPTPAEMALFQSLGGQLPATTVLMKQQAVNYTHLAQLLFPGTPLTPSELDRLSSAHDYSPGDAFVLSGRQVIPHLLMDYHPHKRMETLFIRYVAPLPIKVPAPTSVGSLVDVSRQSRVLLDRWIERPGDRPPLSWCQETVARMLGFGSWHEASVRLAPS